MLMARSNMGESINCQAAEIRKRLAFLKMIEAVLATTGHRRERPTSNWNEVGSGSRLSCMQRRAGSAAFPCRAAAPARPILRLHRRAR